MTNSPDDLTVAEAAARLKLTIAGVRNALRRGRLAGYKLGPRLWRVPLAAIEDYCREPELPRRNDIVSPATRRRMMADHERAMASLRARGFNI